MNLTTPGLDAAPVLKKTALAFSSVIGFSLVGGVLRDFGISPGVSLASVLPACVVALGTGLLSVERLYQAVPRRRTYTRLTVGRLSREWVRRHNGPRAR